MCEEHCNERTNREHTNTPHNCTLSLPKHRLQMHLLKNLDGCDGPDYHQGIKQYLKETKMNPE